MTPSNAPADPHVHHLAVRLARACRHLIQAVLREDERGETDRQFYLVIRQGLEDFQAGGKP